MEKSGIIPPDSVFSFTITKQEQDKRLDHFVTSQFPLYTRSFFKRLIDDGYIKINDKLVAKSGIKLKLHDIVTVHFPPKRAIDPKVIIDQNLPIEVIHKNQHFLILCKPPALMVHPPSQYTTDVTLVDWLLLNVEGIDQVGYYDRPGIVHRLDKDTSGVMIIPLTNYAHSTLSELFKNQKIKKTYLAIVKGHPDKHGSITFPIGRDPHIKTKMKAFPEKTPEGTIRWAETDYKVLQYFDDATLLEVNPKTGRTHQIRVHLASIGHPIIGDIVYGQPSKLIDRQALHAQKIAFEFDNKQVSFVCHFPADFNRLIELLQNKNG